MSTSTKPAIQTPTPTTTRGNKPASLDTAKQTVQRQFVNMALNMMWQLAVVFLVPVVVGAQLDKALDSGHTCVYIGLGVAVIGSVAIMWHAMQVANRVPVPKLTDAQKRAIKKSYEAEDNE
jgi:hypothetical protein